MFAIDHLRRHTVGYLALFVALSGGAYAATTLPANSVGTVQVKNHSLLKADFKNGQIPAGKPGAAGARGPAGTFNAANVSKVAGPMAVLCALGGGDCAAGSSIAQCPGGGVPTGGGWLPQDGSPPLALVAYNGPVDPDGWGVVMLNASSVPGGFQALAVCGSGAPTTLARKSSGSFDALRKTLVQRLHGGALANG